MGQELDRLPEHPRTGAADAFGGGQPAQVVPAAPAALPGPAVVAARPTGGDRRGRRRRRDPGLPPRRLCVPADEVSLPPRPTPGPRRLNVLEGAVVDFPAPILYPGVRRWAATCWPDSAEPGGWGRALWWPSPHHRGWLPVALAYADVVEFGADIPTRRRRRRWWTPVRWYGVAVRDTPGELVVWGPYPTPAAARAVGDELRAMLAYHFTGPRRSR